MDERRGAIRWDVEVPVRYLGLPRHKEGLARTRDLSMTGAQIETVEKHKPGDTMELMLEIPDSNGIHICADAEVVWQNPINILGEEFNYRTGIVFRKIRDCCKQSILDYIIDNKPEQVRSRWFGDLGAAKA